MLPSEARTVKPQDWAALTMVSTLWEIVGRFAESMFCARRQYPTERAGPAPGRPAVDAESRQVLSLSD